MTYLRLLFAIALSFNLAVVQKSLANSKLPTDHNNKTTSKEQQSAPFYFAQNDNTNDILKDILSDSPKFNPRASAELLKTHKAKEKVEVTGSRIKQIDVQEVNPVIVFTKEDLENSGHSTVRDFLRETNISHYGVAKDYSYRMYQSAIGIKGEPTLILINGLPLFSQNSTALNEIPMFAIERVEVLSMTGATGIYDTKALGGVINFITKTDFTGAEFHAQAAPTLFNPLTEGGTRVDLATVFGQKGSNWSYTGSLHYHFQDSIKPHTKEWTETMITDYGPYPMFKVGQQRIYDPRCPDKSKEESPTPPYQTARGCAVNIMDSEFGSTIYPRSNRLYGYLRGDYKFRETTFYSQLITSYRMEHDVQAPLYFLTNVNDIPAGHKMSVGGGQAGELFYRFTDIGPRNSKRNYFHSDLTLGNKGYLSSTWDYDFGVKLSHSKATIKSANFYFIDKLKEAIHSGVYDPFKDPKGDSESFVYKNPVYYASGTDFIGYLGFSGETIWDINLATGLQYYFTYTTSKPDSMLIKDLSADLNPEERTKKISEIANNILGDYPAEFPTTTQHRLSYYLETIKNFFNVLEVQLAGRLEYPYEKFPSSFNAEGFKNFFNTNNEIHFSPRVAFKLKPVDNLLFRASISQVRESNELERLEKSFKGHTPPVHTTDKLQCYNLAKNEGVFNNLYTKLGDIAQDDKEQFVKNFLENQVVTQRQTSLSKEVKDELGLLSQAISKKDYCQVKEYNMTIKGLHTNSEKIKKYKTSLIASLGSHWEITDEHSLSIDTFFIQKKNQTYREYVLVPAAMDLELQHGKEAVESEGTTIIRNDDGTIKTFEFSFVNDNAISYKLGFDLQWRSYMNSVNLYGGTPYFENHLSYIVFDKSKFFEKMKLKNITNDYGSPRWLNKATLGWKNKKHNVSLRAMTVANTYKKTEPLKVMVSKSYEKLGIDLPYTRFDLEYQYLLNKKVSLKLGWHNLLFSTPPYDEGLITQPNALDDFIFETKGPFVFAGLKYII